MSGCGRLALHRAVCMMHLHCIDASVM